MEREACVCDHGYERSDLCAEIIIIIIIIISSTYQKAPGPSGHANKQRSKVGSEAAYITSSWHWVNSIYYSDLNRHVSTQEKPNQRQYITPSSIIVVLYRWPDNN